MDRRRREREGEHKRRDLHHRRHLDTNLSEVSLVFIG